MDLRQWEKKGCRPRIDISVNVDELNDIDDGLPLLAVVGQKGKEHDCVGSLELEASVSQ